MTGAFRHLGDDLVHRGYVWNLVTGTFEAPDGQQFERDIVRSPGAVGIVPLVFDPEGQASVVLVRQYRPAYDDDVIEIPAGMRDVPDEPVADTGARELREEAGLVAERIDHLIDLYPSPGLTDSVTTILLATGCTVVEHERQGPEEQEMELLHVVVDDAIAMIERGEIRDAKTVVGLLLADRRLRSR